MPELSVIIPVYNEAPTIRKIIEKIHEVNVDKEIIVVDDSSTDGTDKILRDIGFTELKVIHHTSNRGKGAAFLTGFDNAAGEYVIIQDADLEYEPNDYLKLLKAIKENNVDIVLGARFIDGHQGLIIERIGNKFLTGTINTFFGSKLNDYATSYKLARKSTFESLNLRATGFNIDVELISKALNRRLRILEVPVSYNTRSFKEGKKIRWGDGLWAVFYMVKYRVHN